MMTLKNNMLEMFRTLSTIIPTIDLNTQNADMETPLLFSLKNEKNYVEENEENKRNSKFYVWLESEKNVIAKTLIATEGVQLNIKDTSGDTALFHCLKKDKDDLDNTQHCCSLVVVGIFELLPLFGGLDDVDHLLRCAWLLSMLHLKRFKLIASRRFSSSSKPKTVVFAFV